MKICCLSSVIVRVRVVFMKTAVGGFTVFLKTTPTQKIPLDKQLILHLYHLPCRLVSCMSNSSPQIKSRKSDVNNSLPQILVSFPQSYSALPSMTLFSHQMAFPFGYCNFYQNEQPNFIKINGRFCRGILRIQRLSFALPSEIY